MNVLELLVDMSKRVPNFKTFKKRGHYRKIDFPHKHYRKSKIETC
jgi:hypothetical protein